VSIATAASIGASTVAGVNDDIDDEDDSTKINVSIPDDSLQLWVGHVSQASAAVGTLNGASFSIKYSVDWPRESGASGVTTSDSGYTNVDGGSISFDGFTVIVPCKVTKSFLSALQRCASRENHRTKPICAQVELWAKKGGFFSFGARKCMVGSSVIPLHELLYKSSVGGALPLEIGEGGSRKGVGGVVEWGVRARGSLLARAKVAGAQRQRNQSAGQRKDNGSTSLLKLVLIEGDQWPAGLDAATMGAATTALKQKPTPQPVPVQQSTPPRKPLPHEHPRFSALPGELIAHPLSIRWTDLYDHLNACLEDTTASAKEKIIAQLKVDSLFARIQNEELSPSMFKSILEQQVERDFLLIAFFAARGLPGDDVLASKVKVRAEEARKGAAEMEV
jgi:hypothetical protein